MRFTKQELFDNFVDRLNGRGKATDGSMCVYVLDDHPGCAIGCQPGFRDRFGTWELDGEISVLLYEHEKIAEWFGVNALVPSEDLDFLEDLQGLHDDDSTWLDDHGEVSDHLRQAALYRFAEKWGLTVPAI